MRSRLVRTIRLGSFEWWRIWRIPILWVLYTGIAWIIVGFVLLALSTQGLVGANVAKHALGVGGVGVLTLGMMSRVALGHTGRPLQPVRIVEWSFGLLNLAALARVFGPLIMFGFGVHTLLKLGRKSFRGVGEKTWRLWIATPAW